MEGRCQNCGQELTDGREFCPNCGQSTKPPSKKLRSATFLGLMTIAPGMVGSCILALGGGGLTLYFGATAVGSALIVLSVAGYALLAFLFPR